MLHVLLLSLLLVFTQTAFVLHELHHDIGTYIARTDHDAGASDCSRDSHQGPHTVCLLCLAFVAVSSGVLPAAISIVIPPSTPEVPDLPPTTTFRSASFPPYFSRAPPGFSDSEQLI